MSSEITEAEINHRLQELQTRDRFALVQYLLIRIEPWVTGIGLMLTFLAAILAWTSIYTFPAEAQAYQGPGQGVLQVLVESPIFTILTLSIPSLIVFLCIRYRFRALLLAFLLYTAASLLLAERIRDEEPEVYIPRLRRIEHGFAERGSWTVALCREAGRPSPEATHLDVTHLSTLFGSVFLLGIGALFLTNVLGHLVSYGYFLNATLTN